MPDSYQIEVEGFDELKKQLRKYPEIAKKFFDPAMESSMLTVQGNVVPNVPVGVSGALRQSYAKPTAIDISGVGANIVGKFGSTITTPYPYGDVMEFGRSAGKMPPPSALERWVHLVLKVPTKDAPGVAFLVARAIGKRGIKGLFFMKKGLEKSERIISGLFEKALTKIVEEIAKI